MTLTNLACHQANSYINAEKLRKVKEEFTVANGTLIGKYRDAFGVTEYYYAH